MIRSQETLIERMARICVVHNPLNARFTNEEVLEAFDRIFKSVDSVRKVASKTTRHALCVRRLPKNSKGRLCS